VKRPTIADVAKKAGVSRSTVSYALSNKRPISEETRQRIQQAIDELGYRPNATAKRMATREVSRNIGFVLPLVAPEITGLELKFIAGASRVINQANYSFVLLAHSDRNDQKLQQFASSGLIDGVILMEVNIHDERVELLQREGIPFVLIGRTADNTGLTYVDTDVAQAMEDCFQHLSAQGHTQIAYLHKDDPEYGIANRAINEYQAACARYQTPVLLQPCDLSSAGGESALNQLLNQHPETTAAIVWSDIPALGAVQALQNRGLQIPQDFGLICQEHSVISKLNSFAPTIIDIRAEEMAAQAAQFMIDLLEDRPIENSQMLFPPKLILEDD
jgi:DNA-binding LacI/PurR family transcriptional regulator